MKLLSWDVGIYNLSYCLLEKNEKNEIKILDWNIVNLVDNEKMKKNRNLLFENIPRKLQEIPELTNVDYVVIENQPSLKNPQMKSIQMILYSYFLILGKVIDYGNNQNYISVIDFCSATNKLKVYDGPKIVLEEKKKRVSKKKDDSTEIIIVSEKPKTDEEEDEEVFAKAEETKKGSSMSYADKKRMAIEYAKYYVEKDFSTYKDFFSGHKKKDDLADSLLQGLYYLKKNIK